MACEQFARTIDVTTDSDRSWQVLTDVHQLVQWVGIVHSVQEIGRLKSYTAVLEDRVGPFRLRADLAVDVVVVDEGSAIDVTASGQDHAINSKIDITGRLRLAPSPSGGTRLTVDGSYQVTGKATSLGAGMVRKKGEQAVEQFFSSALRVLGAADQPADSLEA